MNEVNNEVKSIFALLHEAFNAVQKVSDAAELALHNEKLTASDKEKIQPVYEAADQALIEFSSVFYFYDPESRKPVTDLD